MTCVLCVFKTRQLDLFLTQLCGKIPLQVNLVYHPLFPFISQLFLHHIPPSLPCRLAIRLSSSRAWLRLTALKWGFDSLPGFPPLLLGSHSYSSPISLHNISLRPFTPPAPHSSPPLVSTLSSWCARRSDFTAAFDIFICLFSASVSVSPLPLCLPPYLSLSSFHWEWHDGILQERSPNGAMAFITLPLRSHTQTHT